MLCQTSWFQHQSSWRNQSEEFVEKKKKKKNHQIGKRSELLKRAQVTQLSWDDFSFLQHTEGREKNTLFNIWFLSNLLLTCAPTLGTETVLTVQPVGFMVNIVASTEQNLICNVKKKNNNKKPYYTPR